MIDTHRRYGLTAPGGSEPAARSLPHPAKREVYGEDDGAVAGRAGGAVAADGTVVRG